MTYFDDEADTAKLLRAFYRVWELALSRDESRQLVEKARLELSE